MRDQSLIRCCCFGPLVSVSDLGPLVKLQVVEIPRLCTAHGTVFRAALKDTAITAGDSVGENKISIPKVDICALIRSKAQKGIKPLPSHVGIQPKRETKVGTIVKEANCAFVEVDAAAHNVALRKIPDACAIVLF